MEAFILFCDWIWGNVHITIYGKTFEGETFTVGIENDRSQETLAVAVSFNNEYLWLVNYSS